MKNYRIHKTVTWLLLFFFAFKNVIFKASLSFVRRNFGWVEFLLHLFCYRYGWICIYCVSVSVCGPNQDTVIVFIDVIRRSYIPNVSKGGFNTD